MSSRMQTRRRRRVLALAAVAVGLVVVEPFPKGKVLLSLTHTHGVDTGDIPTLGMMLVAPSEVLVVPYGPDRVLR
jgi:hypothetical protein